MINLENVSIEELQAEIEKRKLTEIPTESLLRAMNEKLDAIQKQQTEKPLTKADILAIENTAERQKAMAEHMDLFR